jgi:endonuclease/exonuclease/phosphatase family metal-dependent hydrolase
MVGIVPCGGAPVALNANTRYGRIAPVSTSLRLLSVDARSFGRDRGALAKAISAAAPDVVCLHRSPHLLRWRSISAAIARRAGLVVVTGGRTAGANLLLSGLGVDVSAVRDVRLPGRPGSAGAALAALRLRGTEFVLVAASLAGTAPDRLTQAQQLEAAIDRLAPGSPPAIISVDGAERPGSPAWQALMGNRVAVSGRVVVDARIAVDEAVEIAGSRPAPALRVDVLLS